MAFQGRERDDVDNTGKLIGPKILLRWVFLLSIERDLTLI